MTNFIDITNFNPKNGDKFLIDANVLLYLFYTAGKYKRDIVKKYSTFYANIIKNDCKILLPLNLLTEFSNRFYKLEYDEYLRINSYNCSQFSFKAYRQTKEFDNVKTEVIDIFKLQIIPYAEKVDYNFTSKNIEELLTISDKIDFNDIIYYDIAKCYNVPIITNDNDFKQISDISIITQSTYLLS